MAVDPPSCSLPPPPAFKLRGKKRLRREPKRQSPSLSRSILLRFLRQSAVSTLCSSDSLFLDLFLPSGLQQQQQQLIAMASEKLLARKGRLRQRYDNEYRLVAGCVPYRANDDGKLEVLMVSTPNRDDLVFPKGGWEDDEDVYEAACREALEEAGVRGNINRASLGLWVFRSKSSQSSDNPRGGACKGHVFALEVTEELEQWPEQGTHGRRWVSPADAYGLCRYEWMREALTALLDRCSTTSTASATESPAALELTKEHAGMCMNMMLMKPASAADRPVALCSSFAMHVDVVWMN